MIPYTKERKKIMKINFDGMRYEWSDLSLLSKIIASVTAVILFVWFTIIFVICIPAFIVLLICAVIITVIEFILAKLGKKVNVHF